MFMTVEFNVLSIFETLMVFLLVLVLLSRLFKIYYLLIVKPLLNK